jgi:hypothetical protein
MVYPPNSEVSVSGGPWQTFAGGAADLPIADADVPIRIRNAACCEEEARTVRPDEAGNPVSVSLGFLPARLIPRCPVAGAQVAIDDKPARLDASYSIPIPSLGTATIVVEFVANDKIDKQRVKVKYNDEHEVTCRFE